MALLAGTGDAGAVKGGNRAAGIGTTAALDGPKCFTPAAVSASERPPTSGASGPMTTNPMPVSAMKRSTAA